MPGKLLRSILIGLIVGGLLLAVMPSLRQWQLSPTTQYDSADESPASYNSAVRRAAPAVVNVYNRALNSTSHNQLTLGSGVIMDQRGYILTNKHVINDADQIIVALQDGRVFEALLVGSDTLTDLAVLKINASGGLPVIPINPKRVPHIGDVVLAIGNPYNLGQTITQGIISATGRIGLNPTGRQNFLQTDASINHGNSGGALVDADGKLIGINTLITSYSGNYSGVGFAIPVNYAVNLAQQIIDGKTPTHAQLGVSLSTVNAQNAKRYGLSVDEGAYVAAVSEGSGAAEAGLQEGDIVTKFDGKDVASASDLMLDVRSKNPGDKVTLDVNRNGETKQVEVTLGSDESSQSASTQQNSAQESMLERLFGGGSGSSQQDAA